MSQPAVPRRQMTPLEPVVRQIESSAPLDGVAQNVAQLVRRVVPAGPVKDALSGTWLGHALHPMLTDLVIGSLMSASLLDLLAPGDDTAGDRLIMVGVAAYAPTAMSGLSDWTDSEMGDDRVRRVGLVHASGNALALGLYIASLVARRGGRRGRGRLLSAAGATVLMGGGYLGGHMSFSRGIGPDQTVFDPGSTDWSPAADSAQLQESKPTRVVVDETPILLLKEGEEIFAIHDRCSHRGCSLSHGSVEGEEIVCGCHGSRFDRRTGAVTGGPATAPQPAFQVRRRDTIVEVRRLDPGSD